MSSRHTAIAAMFLSAAGLALSPALGSAAPPRAYELVSPVDSRGDDVQQLIAANSGAFLPRLNTRVVSDDGNAAAFAAYTGLGADDVSGKGNLFRAARTPEGWQSSYIGPPGARSIYTQVAAFSPDFRTSIVNQQFGGQLDPNDPDRAPDPLDQQDQRLYLRGSSGTYQRLDIGTDMSPLPDGTAFERTTTILQAHSRDLTDVLFRTSRRLEAEPNSNLSDGSPRLYRKTQGRNTLVSVDEDGRPALLGSDAAASKDLSRVYFASDDGRVLLRQNDQTFAVFEPRDGAPGGPVTLANVSDDGLRAVVQTSAQLTSDDTDSGVDLYEARLPSDGDPAAASLSRLTAGDDASVTGTSSVVAASGDGETVYFTSDKRLDSGAGGFNLYVRDGDGTRLVAALDPSDRDAFRLGFGSVTPSARTVRSTPDGQSIAFLSAASLAGTPGGVVNLYRYDNAAGVVECASCAADGTSGPGDARIDEGSQGFGRNITDDGRRVYFETDNAIVPEDTNDASDVYEHVAGSSGPSLVSSGRGSASRYYGNSADGRDVMFLTRQALSPQDRNGHEDALRLYDAREGGGFPVSTPQPPCQGDGCRPPATTASPGPSVGSGNAGPGDVPVPPAAQPPRRLTLRSVTAVSLRRFLMTGRLRVTVAGVDAPKTVRITIRQVRGRGFTRVAATTRTLKKASVARVTLRATKAVRRRLRAEKRVKLRIDVTSGTRAVRKTLYVRGR
jgi:hypothetical protein